MDINITSLASLTVNPIRLHWLRRLARLLLWLAVLGYFGFALAFLSLRYVVLPQVKDYHFQIERMLSDSLGLPVGIAAIDAGWQGLRPQLALHGFQIHDKQGRPGLVLDNVMAEIAWTSLLHFGLRLQRLEIVAPVLTVRRNAQGQIFVAGLQIDAAAQESRFSGWLLAQQVVVVRDAGVTWVDEQRGAPPLELRHLNFHLQNDGGRHRFGLTADPPPALAARLDIRGDFKGKGLEDLASWKGDAYAELDYADLAIWRTWIDYPLDLPQGSGGLRLWLSLAQQQLTEVTADIALDNVKLRLTPDLPLLELNSLRGRISAKRLAQGLELGARRLALSTGDGIDIQPTDFHLKWSDGEGSAGGTFSAQDMNLEAFAKLAAYLPLDNAVRKQLVEAAPRGRLIDMNSAWGYAKPGPSAASAATPPGASGLASYSLQARFERLGMQAIGRLPGCDGISGSINLSERGGNVNIDSQQAAVELPQVFADPHLVFQTLNARASWNNRDEGGQSRTEVKLDKLAFENQDAAGSVGGSYIGRGGEPGQIDLTARLTRASGSSVWRYMPLLVRPNVGDWLRAAILAGSSNDTTLRLKGDLRHFPFADGSGVFEVKGRFHDGALRYAGSWPQIDRISGELEFVGKRMLIKANRASINGVSLSDVKAEIADLASAKEALLISGKAAGPSAEFLRFIEDSPVGEHIDHFTENMRAVGNGQLNLKLSLPLGHLADSKSEGSYQFAGNKLTIDADLPSLSDVNGRLQFSGDGLRADKVRATLLGAPLSVDVRTVGNGTVLVNAEGTLSIADLRKQLSHPLLDHLSGSTAWRGRVRVRKKNVEAVLESGLQGISSSLPEPFNKSAAETQLLRIERQQLPEPPRVAATPARRGAATPAVAPAPPRDQIDVTLGNALAARLVRRHEGARAKEAVLERGAIAIGEKLELPQKGLLLSVNQKKIDVDFWRKLMFGGNGPKSDGGPAGTLRKLETRIVVKAQDFLVFGQALHDLEVKASTMPPANVGDAGWRAEVNSRELAGELTWRNLGAGRLSGHLRQLAINAPAAGKSSEDQVSGEQLKEMPGLDIDVDKFWLRGRPYGKLKLVADNRDGTWEARLDIENEDGVLSGEGQWRPSTTQHDTHLRFTLNVKSIEKLLGRLGYADALRRGSARLEGILSWNGTPFVIDYPSLSGILDVKASNGQFNKLEPGVGRLLGILSLQSLPRRITLDFRDIFSQGMAFDSISGQLNLTRGIMDTRNFLIEGPSAKIRMSGTVDLPQESQNLKIRVSPALTETLAVGAMLAHPAAGVIAWLADKILKNPLDQIFAYDYAVTGSWADPKVEKLSGQQLNIENDDKSRGDR